MGLVRQWAKILCRQQHSCLEDHVTFFDFMKSEFLLEPKQQAKEMVCVPLQQAHVPEIPAEAKGVEHRHFCKTHLAIRRAYASGPAQEDYEEESCLEDE